MDEPEFPATDLALDARVLAPPRARLEAALAAVLDLDEPAARARAQSAAGARGGVWLGDAQVEAQEAWEALAARGVIPDAWAAPSPERVYLAPARGGAAAGRGVAATVDPLTGVARLELTAARAPDVPAPHPPTLRACLTLAADPQGVTDAEALAREVAARLVPWGIGAVSVVAWRVGRFERAQPRERPADAAARAAIERLARADRLEMRAATDAAVRIGRALRQRAGYATEYQRGDALARGEPLARAEVAVGHDLYCTTAWRLAAALDWAVPVRLDDGTDTPRAVADRKYRALADPFDPLIRLWRTGYALDAIEPPRVVLCAAEV